MSANGTPQPQQNENRFARHPIRWLVTIVLSLSVVLVAGSELILSQMDLAPQFRADPLPRHIRLREWPPNASLKEAPPPIRYRHPGGPVAQTYQFKTDHHGFIEPTKVHEHADASIVFLGGSTTETLFVSEKARFPYLAGRLIEARTGKRVDSYNGGKSGNNTLHSIFVLLAKVVPMRPDFVVLMQAANDIGVLSRYGTYWPDDSEFGQIEAPRRSFVGVLRTLRDLTIPRLYRVLRRAADDVAGGDVFARAHAQSITPQVPQPTPADRMNALGQQFRSALTTFVRAAQAWGIRPVLMTQAIEIRGVGRNETTRNGAYLGRQALGHAGLDAASFTSTHAFFNAITRDVARQTGALLIDLEQDYPWSDDELYDALHFSDNGSKIVAGIVADALAPEVSALPERR